MTNSITYQFLISTSSLKSFLHPKKHTIPEMKLGFDEKEQSVVHHFSFAFQNIRGKICKFKAVVFRLLSCRYIGGSTEEGLLGIQIIMVFVRISSFCKTFFFPFQPILMVLFLDNFQ